MYTCIIIYESLGRCMDPGSTRNPGFLVWSNSEWGWNRQNKRSFHMHLFLKKMVKNSIEDSILRPDFPGPL